MPERQLIRLYFRGGVTIDASIDNKQEDSLQWLNHGEFLAVTCHPAPAEAPHA